MNKLSIIFLVIMLIGESAFCDDIFVTNSSGEESIYAKDVIVVESFYPDKSKPNSINIRYYYWNQESGLLNFAFVSGEYKVKYSTKEIREDMISLLKKKGIHSNVTYKHNGSTIDIYCVKVKYGAPEGWAMSGGRPDDTVVDLTLQDGVDRVSFSDLSSIKIEDNDFVKITKKNKQELSGEWKGPQTRVGRRRIFIEGIDDKNDTITIPLEAISIIKFY